MRRLTAKKVRSGLVTAWRLAGWPTSRSPSPLKATIDGVVRAPSEFSITLAFLPSMTATHELVVPRSIPITLAIHRLLSADRAGPHSRPPQSPSAPVDSHLTRSPGREGNLGPLALIVAPASEANAPPARVPAVYKNGRNRPQDGSTAGTCHDRRCFSARDAEGGKGSRHGRRRS